MYKVTVDCVEVGSSGSFGDAWEFARAQARANPQSEVVIHGPEGCWLIKGR